MNMKISALDGLLSFTNGTLGASTTRTQFLESSVGRGAKAGNAYGTRSQFDFHPEHGVSATAFFDGERLERVFLMFRMQSDAGGRWTEALELERKSVHEQWLARELGDPPYDHNWGTVTSDYDPRSCSSEIIIVYDR